MKLKKKEWFKLLFTMLIVFFVMRTFADSKPLISCPFIKISPKIDANENDACWSKATRIPYFVNIMTGRESKPNTTVKICSNGKRLYIFAKMSDNKISKEKKSKKKRDKLNWRQTFEIFLSPRPESDIYYHIGINPDGTLYDNIGQSTANDHNFSIESAVKLTKDGWQAEISLPLTEFGLLKGAKPGDILHINICRTAGAFEETNSCWSPTYGPFHARNKFGSLIMGSYSAAALKIWEKNLSGTNKLPFDVKSRSLSLKKQAANVKTAAAFSKYIKKLNKLRKKIINLIFKGNSLVFWECNPWGLPKSDMMPIGKKSKKIYSMTAVQNEFVSFSLGVANPKNEPVRVRCVPSYMFNAETGETIKADSYLTLRRVVEVGIRGNATQRDALPKLNIESIMDIRSQTNEIIWVTVDTRKMPAGKWFFTLDFVPLIKRSFRSKAAFKINVLPIKMPQTNKPYSYNWARYNWPPTKDILQACYKDQRDHYTNIVQTGPLGAEVALHTLQFDESGKLINEPDFTKLQNLINQFGSDVIYIFGIRYSNIPKQFISGKGISPELARVNFKQYVDALYRLVDKNNIHKENFVWYIEDEPNLKLAKDAVKLAKMFLEARPDKFSTFVTFYSKTSLETIKTLLPYVNFWCPALNAKADQINLVKKHGRKDVRLMGYGVYTRLHDAYWAYRLSPMRALKKGYIGAGFWNYCDAGDSPTSSTWDDYESSRKVSDFAVIYNGSTEPVPSVRWEAWRQGLLDCKFVLWLKQVASKMKASNLKSQALKLADETVNKTLSLPARDSADVYRQKIRVMITKIMMKEGILPKSTLRKNKISIYCLTGNGLMLPNLAVDGIWTTGGGKISFKHAASKITDSNLRFPEGFIFFSSAFLQVDLKKDYAVNWLIFNVSKGGYKCYGRTSTSKWKEIKLTNTVPGIRGIWYQFSCKGAKYRYLKIVAKKKGRKIMGELRIYGHK